MNELSLLNPSDPHPVRTFGNPLSKEPFVFVGDHAGTAIPAALGRLGLSDEDRGRHIAVDLGVEALGRRLSERMDAPYLAQVYSRLVIDCNRHPGTEDWIAAASDGTRIPGNEGLGEDAIAARRKSIFDPYHRAIADLLDRRREAGLPTVFVSLHSFTPVMSGTARPWEIGILHDGAEDAFAREILRILEEGERIIGDNEPYHMDDTDFTVPHHAFSRSLPYVEIEVRQDVLTADTEAMAVCLDDALQQAMSILGSAG